jgi:hypothetical protein
MTADSPNASNKPILIARALRKKPQLKCLVERWAGRLGDGQGCAPRRVSRSDGEAALDDRRDARQWLAKRLSEGLQQARPLEIATAG